MQAASTSDPAAPKLQRLPVNPRRNKVLPEQRKRVIRACNACNVRRVRCTGGQPCQRCAKVNRQCEYPAPESDKTALKDEIERLRRHCADLEAQLGSNMSDASTAPSSSNLHSDGLNLRRTAIPLRVASSSDHYRAIEQGCMLKDDWNRSRFLGETSGATFLDRLKNFMWGLVPLTFPDDSDDGSKFVKSVGRYQTYDSRTLPDPEVELHELPDTNDMIAMLTDLRNCVQDGENDVHSGGIFWWGDLTSLPPNIPKPTGQDITNIVEQDTRYQVLAFPNACFALAIAISHTPHQSTREFGYACFKRARALVRNPLNTVNFTLSDVPTFTMMAFYLIEINRRDAAYMYMSLAAHIAFIHGSFRIERDEASKRNMWTLYILDRWISVLMGRPPVIADEAITLAPPSEAPGLPSPIGLRAHVELSEIAGYIVCDTYKIAPRHKPTGESARETTYYMDQALKFLEDWRTQLPEELSISNPQQQPGPACLMLHMRYNQLIVLTTRPVFFAAVKRAVANQVFPEKSSKAMCHELQYMKDCATAAHENILLAKRVLESNGRLLQAGLHLTFNAAVVLLLNSIMAISCCGGTKEEVLSASTLSSDEIDLAISIFKQEKETGTAYHRDCHDVLKDLKALKERYLAYKQGPTDSAFAFDEAVFEVWIQEDGLGLQDTLLI